MSYECHDVCQAVRGMLHLAGVTLQGDSTGDPDENQEQEIIEALDLCSLERDEFLRELRDALDAAMTELETVAKATGWDMSECPCWPKCAAAIAKTEGKLWLQKAEDDYLRVEYLVAWEDGTWTTTIKTVPGQNDDTDYLTHWAHKNLAGLPEFRKAVLFAVYSVPAQEE